MCPRTSDDPRDIPRDGDILSPPDFQIPVPGNILSLTQLSPLCQLWYNLNCLRTFTHHLIPHSRSHDIFVTRIHFRNFQRRQVVKCGVELTFLIVRGGSMRRRRRAKHWFQTIATGHLNLVVDQYFLKNSKKCCYFYYDRIRRRMAMFPFQINTRRWSASGNWFINKLMFSADYWIKFDVL
jgi:hypothetical protein